MTDEEKQPDPLDDPEVALLGVADYPGCIAEVGEKPEKPLIDVSKLTEDEIRQLRELLKAGAPE